MIIYENETYLSTDEASNYIGKTTTNFRQFIARNPLPRRKLGGRLYFPVKELNGYFAKRAGMAHFESTIKDLDQVYTVEQLGKIFLTTKANIYSFLKKNGIQKYKDNFDRTLYDRAQIDAILNNSLTPGTVSDI